MILRYAFILVSALVLPFTLSAQNIEWKLSSGPLGGNIADVIRGDQDVLWTAVEFGGGVYSSADGGNSWQQHNQKLPNRDCRALAYDADKDMLLLATEGGGIYVSSDDGDSWVARNSGLDNLFLYTVFHEGDEVVWAGTQGSGPYRSDDNGLNWEAANTGLSESLVNDFAVTADGSVFCATVISGIQRSKDDGQSWERVALGIGTSWILSLEVGPDDVLYAGTNKGFFKSEDQGDNWTEINTGVPDNTFVRDMAIIDNTTIIAATSRGAYFSNNAGASWTERSGALVETDLFCVVGGDEWVVGAHRDRGLARSENQGMNWLPSNNGLYGVGIWSLTRADDGKVFAGSQSAIYRSNDDGDTWDRLDGGLPSNTFWSIFLNGGGKVFAGLDGGLWQSINNGDTWTQNSLDNVTVYAMKRAPDGTLWAASSDGMFKSTDGGDTWEQSGQDDRLMTTLEIDVDGNLFSGEFFQGIWRSTDNGQNWSQANSGLGNRDVTSLVSNTVGTWIAGTRNGVFYSINRGLEWNPANKALTDTEVLTLAVNQRDDLFAGTFSGGIFRSTGPNDDWETLDKGLLTPSVQALEMSNFDVLFAGTLAGSVYRTIGTTNPVEIAMPDDAEICPGGSVELTTELSEGFPDYTHNWEPATGLNDASLLSPTATPEITTWYYITVSDRSGFEQRDSVLITVLPAPDFDAGEEIVLCAGESLQREYPDELTYSWSPAAGISCTDCADPTFSPTATTVYSVTVTSPNGCSLQDELSVVVNQLPQIQTQTRVELCPGESTQLSASGGVAYEWSPATDLDDPASATPTVTPTQSREYTLTVTGENGCENSVQVAVVVFEKPDVNAGQDAIVCAGRSTQLQASGASSYVWSPAEGLSCVDCANPLASPDVTTVYTVVGTDANGCSAEDQIQVEVREAVELDFSTQDIYFGVLSACESSAEQKFSISNSGAFDVTLRGWQVEGNNFSLISPQFPVTVPANGTVEFTARYTPQNEGGHQTQLSFNASPCPIETEVTLRGENQGVVARVEPGAIKYTRGELCGDLPDPERPISVTNSSDGVVTLVSATPSGPFNVTGPQLPLNMNANDATGFTVTLDGDFTQPASGELTIEYVSDACNGTLRVSLSSEGTLFDVDVSDDVSICRGDNTRLSAQADNAAAYMWSPATGLDDPNSPTPTARPFSTTEYEVTVFDEDGCSAVETVTVTVEFVAKPGIDVNGALLTCTLDDLEYQWLRDDIEIPNATEKTFQASIDGSYRVVVRNSFGCRDMSDAVTVSTTDVAESDMYGGRLRLFPNPAGAVLGLQLHLPFGRRAHVQIFSALGQVVLSQTVNLEGASTLERIDIGALTPGVYYLVVDYEAGRLAAPFVRE